MPLLLHHSSEIVALWIEAAEKADDDALRALFEYVYHIILGVLWINCAISLLEKLVHDLRNTLLPSYMPLLQGLLTPLPRSLSAETLTVLLTTLSSFFKHLLVTNPQLLAATWSTLSHTLPKCNPEVQRAVAEAWATVLRRCKGETREAAVTLAMQDIEVIPDASAWMFIYAFKVRSCIEPFCRLWRLSSLLAGSPSRTPYTHAHLLSSTLCYPIT